MEGEVPGSWDELRDALRDRRAFGVVTIRLSDGKPTLIDFHQTFKTVEQMIEAVKP